MFHRLPEPVQHPLVVYIDGQPVEAFAGETVACLLLRTPPAFARHTPITNSPRLPYCMMGICFDCLAIVDGRHSMRTCLTPVHDGMTVKRQLGAPEV